MKIFPNAGTVNPGQLGISLGQQNLQREKMYRAAKMAARKKRRQQQLMSTFESLPSYGEEDISNWVQQNNVTVDEINAIRPIIKERRNRQELKQKNLRKDRIRQDLFSISGEITRDKINAVLKKHNVQGDEFEDLKPIIEQVTSKKKFRFEKDKNGNVIKVNTETGNREPYKEKFKVYKDAQGNLMEKNQFTGNVNQVQKGSPKYEQYMKNGDLFQKNLGTGKESILQEAPDQYEQYEKEGYRLQRNKNTGRESVVAKLSGSGTGLSAEDLAASRAEAYDEIEKEFKSIYFNQNLTPDKKQRSQYNQAMVRAMDYMDTVVQETGIPYTAAVPLARKKMMSEDRAVETLQKSLPEVNKGGLVSSSTVPQTVKELKSLQNKMSIEPHVIRRALVKKGWDNDSINQIMSLTATLVDIGATALDPKVVKSMNLSNGEGVRDKNGDVWKRDGDFLINVRSQERVQKP